ncbi:MAG: CD225/dispanin family protein [Chitinispirillia bacterium]|nr:CD225/dispanin family protein [Chitinispirillia bacterium]MCL2269328.1 CD225/dispanin family protein [Chitinispirillia bacterium]
MKYCPKCWAESADGAKFCANCGAEQAEAAFAEELNADEETNADETEAQETRRPTVAFSSTKTPDGEEINKNIESHLVKAILSTICCCLPFTIVAIVFAAQAEQKLRAKNYAAALDASKKANLWSNVAIGMGILMMLIGIIFYGTIIFRAIMDGTIADINGFLL